MKIQTKAALSIALSFLIAAIVLLVVFSSLLEMEAERAHIKIYGEIKGKVDALNLLTARGVSTALPSRIRQIKEIEQSLGDLLRGLTTTHPREAFLMQQIEKNSKELGHSIESLRLGDSGLMEIDRQDILISHIWMQAQLVSDDCNRLLDISQNRIDAAQEKTGLLILGLIAALVLTNAAISYLFGRNILHQQQRLQHALTKAEAGDRMLSALMEHVPEGITIADAELNLVQVSRYGQELLRGSLSGKSTADAIAEWKVYHPDGTPLGLEEVPLVRAIGCGEVVKDIELVQLSSEGSRLPLLCSAGPMRDNAGAIVGGIVAFRDISERKRVEQDLREKEEELSKAQRLAHIGSWYWDAKTDVFTGSDELLRIYGFDSEMQKMPDFKEQRGRCYPVEDWERINAAVQRSLESGIGYELDVRAISRGEIIWVTSRSEIVRDADDRIVGLRGTVQDITERKQAEDELRRLNEKLEALVAVRTALAEARTRQLRELAIELIETEEKERRRFADLLHEDLQQMLAAARMQVQAVADTLPSEPMLSNVAQLLKESIAKSRRLSHELSPAILHQAGLIAILEWLARQVHEQFGLKVELKLNTELLMERTTQKVFLFRAVQELLFNIVKHAGVQSAGVEVSSSEDSIIVTVSDQGRGFDPEILQKGYGRLGFGLLTIKERAGYIGGGLMIESSPGQGSRFTLSVPNAGAIGNEEAALDTSLVEEQKLSRPQAAVSAVDGTRVLFVDDHHVMRQGLIKLVKSHPAIHVVGEASNGREALEQARKLMPDVIVMDISMPEMDGIEATRRIKAELPKMRVIGLTMHDDVQPTDAMQQAGADMTLSKTVSAAELVKAIYGRQYKNKETNGKTHRASS